jgi:hypothetical protein
MVFMIIAVAFLAFPGSSDDKAKSTTFWPLESKRAAQEIYTRYGKPDVESRDLLIWNKRGRWDKIAVSRIGVLHRFPFEHYDVLEQTISYKVPAEKLHDLIMFDGSLLIDRTRGTVSVRCDRESSNMLVLNLAHDVATGKRSATEARLAYTKVIRDKQNGADPVLMKNLFFSSHVQTNDPDVNTTGLTLGQPAPVRKKWYSRLIAAAH